MKPIDAAWDILKSRLQQPFRGIMRSMSSNTPEEVLHEASRLRPDQKPVTTMDEAEQMSADFLSRKLSDVALQDAMASFAPENYYFNIPPEYQNYNDIEDEEGNILRRPSEIPFIHGQRKRRATNYDIGANPDSIYPTDKTQDIEMAAVNDPDFRSMVSLTPAPVTDGSGMTRNQRASPQAYFR